MKKRISICTPKKTWRTWHLSFHETTYTSCIWRNLSLGLGDVRIVLLVKHDFRCAKLTYKYLFCHYYNCRALHKSYVKRWQIYILNIKCHSRIIVGWKWNLYRFWADEYSHEEKIKWWFYFLQSFLEKLRRNNGHFNAQFF